MAFGSPEGVTPGRETRVVLGEYPPLVLQPLFALHRSAHEIGRSSLSAQVDVEYVAGIGYRLRSYSLRPSAVFERNDAQSGILTSAELTLADYHELVYGNRQVDLPDVDYNDVPASGSPSYQKRPGNASFKQRLEADQSAYPSPNPSEDASDMDRVAISKNPHYPDETLVFRVYVPGSVLSAYGPVATAMFSGPAGSDRHLRGFGQYAVKVFGDGESKLYERGYLPDGGIGWVSRAIFRVSPGIANSTIQFRVVSDASESCQTGFYGTKITFNGVTFPDARHNEGVTAIEAIRRAGIAVVSSDEYVYTVPQLTKEPVQVVPIRLDVRRDIRAMFQISKSKHPYEGQITDEPFSIPFFPVEDSTPFKVEWYGDTPIGTSIDAKMYRADTDEELVGTAVLNDCFGGVKTFEIPEGHPSAFYLQFLFAGIGTNTPTLTSYKVYKDAVFGTPEVDLITLPQVDGGLSLPKTFGSEYSITLPAENPQEETASVKIFDLANAYSEIRSQSGSPCAIKVYDTDDNLLSVLHRGFITRATSQILVGEDEFTYPAEDSYMLDLTTKGEWERAKRQLAPRRLHLWDGDANKPLKVIDALLLIFHEMGYTGDMVQFPLNLDIRLFGNDEGSLSIEPATPLMDIAVGIAADYLGGFLLFDPNAGDYGRWRLLLRKNSPYRILARFDPNHPGAMKLAHRMESYGTSTIDGQTVPHVPIFNGQGIETPTFTYEPAEGNVVVVTGGSEKGGAAASQSAIRLQQVAINFDSFNVYGLPPEHPHFPQPGPDYLGEMVPIEVFDITLDTQEAVNWVCRRVYDYACFARETYTFTGPLVFVWDPDDLYQVNVRPLRFLDAVQVKQRDGSWKTYIVASVKLGWKRDNLQLAAYELVHTSRIDQYGIPLGKFDFFDLWRKALTGTLRNDIGLPKRARQQYAGQRRASPNHSKWAGLPEINTPKIQDIDPDSPTFGQFYFMAGYDPA